MAIKSQIKNIALFIFLLWPAVVWAQTAALLPNAVQQFFDNNGNPLSAGTVTTYAAGTSSLKTTWRDANEIVPNTNPIVLDAGGKAIIYGSGTYRQVVRDRLGNLIWDAVTSAASGGGGSTLLGDGQAVGSIKPWAGITVPQQYTYADGRELSRVTYSALFLAINQTSNVVCTNGSPIVTSVADTTEITIGRPVELSCVPAGTTVVSKTASTVTLSNNSTITANSTAVFFPFGNGNGTTTFNIPDLRGVAMFGRTNMGGNTSAILTQQYYGANPAALGANGGIQNRTLLTSNLPAYTPTGSIVSTSTPTDPGHFHLSVVGATSASTLSGTNTVAQSDGSTYALKGDSGTINQSKTETKTTGVTVATTSSFTGTAQGGTSTAFSIVPPGITMNFIIKVLPDSSLSIMVVTSIGGMYGDILCGGGLICSSNTINANIAVPLDAACNTPFNLLSRNSTIWGCAPGLYLSATGQFGVNTTGVSGGVMQIVQSGPTANDGLRITRGASDFRIWGDNVNEIFELVNDGSLFFSTGQRLNQMELHLGLIIGNPTGTDKGLGTINASAGFYDNGQRLLSGRKKITTNTEFYVANSSHTPPGVDVAGCGTTRADPCATANFKYYDLLANYEFSVCAEAAIVHLDNAGVAAVFTNSLQAFGGPVPGQCGPSNVVFRGDQANHPELYLVQPTAGTGDAFSAAFGAEFTLTNLWIDQSQSAAGSFTGTGSDITGVVQGSKIAYKAPLIFGCTFLGFNMSSIGFFGYAEFQNGPGTEKFTINVGLCHQQVTANYSMGDTFVTATAAVPTIGQGQGLRNNNVLHAADIPTDAFVGSIIGSQIHFGCAVTLPANCVVGTSRTGETMHFDGGGQTFVDVGNLGTVYFSTNGQPDYSNVFSMINHPFYNRFLFINDNSNVNGQALTFESRDDSYGGCFTTVRFSLLDTNFQGIPYLPCLGGPNTTTNAPIHTATVSSGSNTFTLDSIAGVVVGQYVNGVAFPTGTVTAGSATIPLNSTAGICTDPNGVNALKVTGPGILSAATLQSIGMTLGAITAGSGGTPGTYAGVSLTGGTGTGALATIVVGGGGTVTTVTLTTAGVGYTVADTLTAAPGGVSGFSVPVATTFITVGGCGGGPKCVSGSPTYNSGLNQTNVKITVAGCGVPNESKVVALDVPTKTVLIDNVSFATKTQQVIFQGTFSAYDQVQQIPNPIPSFLLSGGITSVNGVAFTASSGSTIAMGNSSSITTAASSSITTIGANALTIRLTGNSDITIPTGGPTHTLALIDAGPQTWTGVNNFNTNNLAINGSTSGNLRLNCAAVCGTSNVIVFGQDFTTSSGVLQQATAGAAITVSTTLPAITLGGTVAGNGQQLNNIIIGTTTPRDGSFTTLTASTSATSPIIYGGTAAGSSLSLVATSGTGVGAEQVLVKGGTAGGTTWATFAPVVSGAYVFGSDGGGSNPLLAITGPGGGNASMNFMGGGNTAQFSINNSAFLIKTTTAAPLNITTNNSGTSAISVDTSQHVSLGSVSNESGSVNAVCINSSGQLLKGTTATGTTCAGTSAREAKDNIVSINGALATVAKLNPTTFRFKPGYNDDGKRLQYGFIADEIANVLPELVGYSDDNRPISVSMVSIIPIIVRAIQELKADNDNLRQQLQRRRNRK